MDKYKRAHGVFLPNRLATYLLVLCGAAAAVLPVLANLDWTSTAGVIAGIGAVAAALVTWLKGWQQNESENLAPFIREAGPAPEPARIDDPEDVATQRRIDEIEHELRGVAGELHAVETLLRR